MRRRIACLLAFAIAATMAATLAPGMATLLAKETASPLYAAQSVPQSVATGPQPLESPVILSVKVATGGDINDVTVNLFDLLGASYHDPVSGAIEAAGALTPMSRVYEIDGEDAYFLEAGSRHEYNLYRTARTHQIVRGSADATNRWQVELPNTGRKAGDFSLAVTATNETGQQSTITIDLEVADDTTPPALRAWAEFAVPGPATSPGNTVLIRADTTDDASGVHAVWLDGDAQAAFGKTAGPELTREIATGRWTIENTIADTALPGTYSIDVIATDRAGNRSIETLRIQVAQAISLFQVELQRGWNLISVPKALKNPDVAEAFAGMPVESVQTVIEGERMEVTRFEPGLGYLVKATDEAAVVLELADHDPSAIPLTMNLGPGWNLIGYASQSLEPHMPLTYYLGTGLKDNWTVVIDENGAQARSRSTSPYVWAMDSFPTVTGQAYSQDEDRNLPAVELGKAYWIYLTGEGTLIP